MNGSGVQGDAMAPSLADIEALARDAYADLPAEVRRLCGDIVFLVADFAPDDVLDEMGIPDPFDLMGLFEGHGLAAVTEPTTGQHPNRISLYRRAMLDYWCEHEETLEAVVAHVLVHEIGHHFGLSDADMEALEAAADEEAKDGMGEGTGG